MMQQADKINLAGSKAKGKRPYFLADKQTEQVLSIAMSLAMELSVSRERVSTLEKLLEAKGILSREEVDSFKPDNAEVAYRSEQSQAYIARILRIIQQDKEAISATDDLSVEEVETILRAK